MSEEDIKDAAVDAAEEEKSEYDKLADFVDLEDLSSLMGEDDFADLDDLGDISDLDLNGDEGDIPADMTEKLPEQQPLVKDEVPEQQPLVTDEVQEQSNQAETVEKAQVTEESEASLDDLVGDFLNDLDAAGGVAEPESNDIAPDSKEDEASLQDSIPDDLESLLAFDSHDTEEDDGAGDSGEVDISQAKEDEMPVAGTIQDAAESLGETRNESESAEDDMQAAMDALLAPKTAGTEVTDALVEPEADEPKPEAADMLVEPEQNETVPEVADALVEPEQDETRAEVADALVEPEDETFSLDDILALDEDGMDNSDDDMQALLEGLGGSDIPEELSEVQEVTKKPGLLKRLFGNVVTDEIAEAELAERAKEQEEEAAKKEAAEAAKEEKKAAKAAKAEEKAEAKKAKAEEKELKKAAKEEEKAAQKAEKAAKKAEEDAEAELEITGKLNKVGVSIVVILAAMFLAAEISGTKIFSYRSTIKEATSFFDAGRYTDAYQEILGTDMKKTDQETYDKIVTVMKVQRALNSYENYDNMKYYPDALNALLVGLKKYDENLDTAKSLEVEEDLDSCRDKIVTLLDEEYGLSESQARELLVLDKTAYTDKVVAIAMKKQS